MMWEWLETIFGVQFILLVFWAYVIYAVGAAIFIILDNRQPTSTFAWLFLFILLPLVGVGIYILFGREMRPFSRRSRLARLSPAMESSLAPYLEPLVERERAALRALRADGELSHMQGKLAEMLRRTNLAMLTVGNQVELLQDASSMYPRLEEDIRNAQHSIHMEYFTWTADKYMQELGDLLIERAQAGVRVRILYDALGSLSLDWRHRGYVGRLRRGGVEIYSYLNRFFLLSLHSINYRNHRKITVIDGRIGYTGGLNMGLEHLEGAGPYNAWRDTHLRITGETAAVLQAVFATSWYNTTNEHLADRHYFAAADVRRRPARVPIALPTASTVAPHAGVNATDAHATDSHAFTAQQITPMDSGIPGDGITPPTHGYAQVPVQIVGAGPDSQWYAIQQLYFFMIPLANSHVYIQSPFFIPDASVSEALKAAALAGVDVRIMCARRDTMYPVPNWAANTYFDDMARAGVKIYLMQSAYMHSKTISIDSTICSVGSANMDLRSFQINYEINAVLYHRKLAQELEDQFHKDLEDCVQFNLESYRSGSNFAGRMRDSLARLVSPLL
ncbi:MAG: phospholipase D-like domain-containing protein [Litorilinea sp.]